MIISKNNAELKIKIKGLLETLPNIKAFSGKYVVLKYGGSILNESVEDNIISQVVFLKKYIGINMVIVHGGGKHVDEEIARRGMQPTKKIAGKRQTSKEILPVLNKCFGELNRRIVSKIKKEGCPAIGFHGSKSIIRVNKDRSADLGFVGVVKAVTLRKLKGLPEDCIPVISSLGLDSRGQLYNVNADDVAAGVGVALKAAKYIILTDVRGIKTGRGDDIFSTLTTKEVESLIKKGTVSGGMIPKLRSSVDILKKGVEKVHIIKGTDENSIIEEILSAEGVGTQIISKRKKKRR